jgi:hypothetical protein
MSQRFAVAQGSQSVFLAARLAPFALLLVSLVMGSGALAAEPCLSSLAGGC